MDLIVDTFRVFKICETCSQDDAIIFICSSIGVSRFFSRKFLQYEIWEKIRIPRGREYVYNYISFNLRNVRFSKTTCLRVGFVRVVAEIFSLQINIGHDLSINLRSYDL